MIAPTTGALPRRPRRPRPSDPDRGAASRGTSLATYAGTSGLGAVAWAVFLGCTSEARLSREWGCPKKLASDMLVSACRAGLVRRIGRGQYRADQP